MPCTISLYDKMIHILMCLKYIFPATSLITMMEKVRMNVQDIKDGTLFRGTSDEVY